MRPLLLTSVFVLSACPKDSGAGVDANDRAIARLQAEKARLASDGPAARPQLPDAVAQLAEASSNPKPAESLTISRQAAQLGPVTIQVKSAEVSQSIHARKTVLSTIARFVKVVLVARTNERTRFALDHTRLVQGSYVATIATDVQRVAQGSPLGEFTLEPNVTQELVLYFEAEPPMLTDGLALTLEQGTTTVTLPLGPAGQ